MRPDGGEGQRAWDEARNVLAVRLDNVGDVLMTTPAIRALTRSGRRITLLTSRAGAEVARMIPEVDEVLVYEAPWMKATAPRASPDMDLRTIEELRGRGFDAAVVFTVHTQSALPASLLCYLAGIPLRLAHARENPYQLLTHHVPETETDAPLRHEVRRQLDLVAAVGVPAPAHDRLSIRVPEQASRRAEGALTSCGVDPTRPWVVLHPGASAPSRRYPPERFAEAAAALIRDHGWQAVVTGDRSERGLAGWIRDRAGEGCFSLAGSLGLPELAGLIAAAPALITNNTGPSHIASAVSTPVVVLYALTNLQHTPWKVPSVVLFHDVPCRGCLKSVCPEGHHLCLRGVPAERVVEAALRLATDPAAGGRARATAGRPGARG